MHVFDEVIEALGQNGYDQAENLLTQADFGDSPLHEVWNKVGVIAMEQGKTEIAQYCFNRSVAMEPRFANALSNLGNIMKEKGDTDEAIRLYNRAIEANPDYPTAYHNLGVLYKEQGRLDKAVPLLKKSLRTSAKVHVKGPRAMQRKAIGFNWRYLMLFAFLAWLFITVFIR